MDCVIDNSDIITRHVYVTNLLRKSDVTNTPVILTTISDLFICQFDLNKDTIIVRYVIDVITNTIV